MIGIGRVIVKIAGRDAGMRGVVVDTLDDNHVLIDGQVRRRKCNVLHIEPLPEQVSIPKGASHEQVREALQALGIAVPERKDKGPATPKQEAPRKKAAARKPAGKAKKATSAAGKKAR